MNKVKLLLYTILNGVIKHSAKFVIICNCNLHFINPIPCENCDIS